VANAVLERAVPVRTYTWDDLVLMWRLGREFGHLEVATAIDEARSVPQWLPQSYTEAERRAARLANVPVGEVNSWIREHRGEPVVDRQPTYAGGPVVSW